MKYDNYEDTLRSFPHWLDKNPYSNFSKVIKVINRQYLDKYHKVKCLEFAERLIKPFTIHKEQENLYEYSIISEVMLPNIKTVNFYVNPVVDDYENILSYEKCFTEEYKDDGYNDHYLFQYDGDTRKRWANNETTPIDDMNYDDYHIVLDSAEKPIIPMDNFILEVITYDDYRWLKGFPENDNTDLYRIYKETQSYTKYLTFEIKKQNIKKIQIFKDNELIFEEDFFIINENGSIIYNDYKPSQVVNNPNTDVMVADPDKKNYTLRVLLTPEDYDDEGNIKSNFDLYVITYDLNNPNCPQYDKINHKRYNGNDKTNYDCFTHDYSLDMIGTYWNIPRLEFQSANYENQCDKLNNNYYSQTYPPYNDRLTEDDYHYQNRMQTYIQGYNKVLFPVLELWKNYQVWGDLRSRKDILSTQGKSYLTEYPYYEDTTITVESKNLLNIIEGESNNITINNHSWHETILADNLYIVPETEYHLNCTIETQEPISSNERLTYHIYYYDKRNQCITEEVYNPKMVETLSNTYKLDKTFKTREDVVTVDVVLEYDNPFSFKEAMMRRLSIADKDAMYMATKNDYHSCVYDLTVDYTDVPTNINFSNTRAFEKLLQRSLPLSHKGYLNIGYTEKTEDIGLCDGFGNLGLVNIFDENNDHSEGEDTDFIVPINHFYKDETTYHLRVEFINHSDDDKYITTTIEFDDEEIIEIKKLVHSNPNSAILSYNFRTPKDTSSMSIQFNCNGLFRYKGLVMSRNEKIQLEELWGT